VSILDALLQYIGVSALPRRGAIPCRTLGDRILAVGEDGNATVHRSWQPGLQRSHFKERVFFYRPLPDTEEQFS
jgi:hypothetical protein